MAGDKGGGKDEITREDSKRGQRSGTEMMNDEEGGGNIRRCRGASR